MKIVIGLRGGLVQWVGMDRDAEILVVDWDDDIEPEDMMLLPFKEGENYAVAHSEPGFVDEQFVGNMFAAFFKNLEGGE